MGTRGIIRVYDEEGRGLVQIYRHYDCYPEGLGKELVELYKRAVITNGVVEKKNHYNGMGCFAASLIAKLKTKVGNVYLFPFDEEADHGQEFNYDIKCIRGDSVSITCREEVGFGFIGGVEMQNPSDVRDAKYRREAIDKAAEMLKNKGETCDCGFCTETTAREESESSVIKRATYDWPSKILTITFQETEAVYNYFDVPNSFYAELLNAESKGNYFNKYIKGEFKHERVR